MLTYESETDPATRINVIEALTYHYSPAEKTENRKLFQLYAEGAKLAEKINNNLHFLYLKGMMLQTLFFKLVNDLNNQILIQKVSHESQSDFEAIVSLSILKTNQMLGKVSLDFAANMRSVEEKRYYVVFTDLLRRHALMMLYLYQSLVVWVDANQTNDLLKSAETDLSLALKVSEYTKWDDMRCMVLDDMATLYFFRNDRDSIRSALGQARDCRENRT